jgi:hypothetical protein
MKRTQKQRKHWGTMESRTTMKMKFLCSATDARHAGLGTDSDDDLSSVSSASSSDAARPRTRARTRVDDDDDDLR